MGQVCQEQWFTRFPDATDDSFPGRNCVEPEITLEDRRIRRPLLENMDRDFDEGRATLRDKRRRELTAGAFHHVKRSALRVQNPGSTFDDQPMQIGRANRFCEGFTEPVEKIEDESFLDLDFFLRALQLPNPDALLPPGEGPASK